jgi:hypothetical protein
MTVTLLLAGRWIFAANEGKGSRYPNNTVTSEFSCVFCYIKGRRIVDWIVC